MNKPPDAVAPLHPFPEGSAAALAVRALDKVLSPAGWQFAADDVSWTADRGGDPTLHVEDGVRYGQGPILTAQHDGFQYVLRAPVDTTLYGLHLMFGALITLRVLPEGRYFC